MKKLLFLIVFAAISSLSHSQSAAIKIKSTTNARFSKLVKKIDGDLNKDNISDVVKVFKDPKKGDFKASIFFGTQDGKYTLINDNTTLLSVSDGTISDENFPLIEIKKGILILNYELLRGQSNYKFRFQNSNFEMIGYDSTSSDGNGYMEKMDINLSTKIKITTLERYDVENSKPEIKKEKITIASLPKFQTFNPVKFEY